MRGGNDSTDRLPYVGPNIPGRNLCTDQASRNNIYVSIEASYTDGKGKDCKTGSYPVSENID